MVGNTLENLFAKSPIKPLQEHIQIAVGCAEQLAHFFDASFSDDWIEAEAIYQKMGDAEHQADDLKTQIRLNMPRSLFMPIARNDLLKLTSQQDELANIAKDIAGVMLGRAFAFPSVLKSDVNGFVASAIQAAQATKQIVNELDELLQTGFSGRELETAKAYVMRLDALEDTADELEIKLRASLKGIETEIPPIDAMFLYKVISLIGSLADQSQAVGDQLYIIIAR